MKNIFHVAFSTIRSTFNYLVAIGIGAGLFAGLPSEKGRSACGQPPSGIQPGRREAAMDDLSRPGGPFRRAAGQHIRLTTDVPLDVAQTMVVSFDAAVSRWATEWSVEQQLMNRFSVDALVMADESKFRDAGLIPAEVPDFSFGYALGSRLFVRATDSDYYTRHLLLHEGFHSFAFEFFGETCPTWFMEGSAEWSSTHRGVSDKIEIGVMPADRREVPLWGRYKSIELMRRGNALPSLETVLRYPPTLKGDVESYACSWAAVAMLKSYPEYHDLVTDAARFQATSDNNFNRQFAAAISPSWPILAARWRLWLDQLDYGFRPGENLSELSIRDPLIGPDPVTVPIAANRGWQSCGVRIPANRSVTISAGGWSVVASDPEPWRSSPRGVSLRYVRDRPLGQLIVAVLPNRPPSTATLPPLRIEAVGEKRTLRTDEPSWLCFQINDDCGERSGNSGGYQVTVSLDNR